MTAGGDVAGDRLSRLPRPAPLFRVQQAAHIAQRLATLRARAPLRRVGPAAPLADPRALAVAVVTLGSLLGFQRELKGDDRKEKTTFEDATARKVRG